MLENYLLDKEFLLQLDMYQHREIFARITALTQEGKPLEYIEGKITQGSINIDGSSVVRRTCNLTMVAQDVDIHNFYWGIKTQFQLEVGLRNVIDTKYPDIIWFPQGIYLVATFNTSLSTNNYTITISGKDKMCMLNGDLGGNLPASIDFGKEEFIRDIYQVKSFNNIYEYATHTYYVRDGYKEYTGHFNPEQTYYVIKNNRYVKYTGDDFHLGTKYYIENYVLDGDDAYDQNKTYYTKESVQNKIDLPLKRIIKEMVHAWGGEPYHNIIINNLDTYGLEQLSFRGEDVDLFCLRLLNEEIFNNVFFSQKDILQGKKLYIVTAVDDNNKVLATTGTAHFASEFVDGEQLDDIDIVLEKGVDDLSVQNPEVLTKVALAPMSGSVIGQPAYTMLRLTYGDDVGYRLCDLIYAGELISSIGETVTSILDKIKTMLGDYEYFYNLDGQFVFQRKQTYTNTSWNSIVEMPGENRADPAELSSSVTYSFIGNKMTTQISNNPALNNAKNDYSVWGVRKSISGAEIPVHARYAIDKKPIWYKSLKTGKVFATKDGEKEYQNLLLQVVGNEPEWGVYYFERDLVPDGIEIYDENGNDISTDWWDMRQWQEYYRQITGQYPDKEIREYGTEPFKGTIRFRDGTVKTFTNQLVIDYYINTGLYESSEHTYSGCHHTYNYFLEGYARTNNPIGSLIYKPKIPTSDDISVTVYYDSDNKTIVTIESADYIVDWREILYQMAIDYFQFSNSDVIDNATNQPVKDIFLQKVGQNNPILYPSGITGYEQYYTDIEGFWRQLYNPGFEFEGSVGKQAEPQFTWVQGHYEKGKEWHEDRMGYDEVPEWKSPTVESVTVPFYIEETDEWDSIFTQKSTSQITDPNKKAYEEWRNQMKLAAKEKLELYMLQPGDTRLYWNSDVFLHPEVLNFWFDFLDDDTELASISRPVLGDRSKVVNDNKVTSIYFKQVPNFIFAADTVSAQQRLDKTGYNFINLPKDLEQLFSISYRGKSAKDEIDNLLYQHSYCTENISITSVPIYYLQPNTRIFVEDNETNINGEYIMTKFTVPLQYNGTMSITANKAPTRIY